MIDRLACVSLTNRRLPMPLLPLRAGPTSASQSVARLVVASYAVLLVVTLAFWFLHIAGQTSLVGYAHRTDFLAVYVGARTVATGHAAQLYDVGMQRSQMNQAIVPYHRGNLMAFVYPGYVAVLLAPLGALSFSHAVLVFLAVNSVVVLWMAFRVATRFSDSPRDRLVLLMPIFAFVPLQLSLLQNQLGLVPTLGILEGVLALRSDRPARAGWWLLIGLVKPQLIAFPLLALLFWRCWSALVTFFVGFAAVLGLSIATLGWWIPRYMAFLREYSRSGAGMSLFPIAMQNWRGLGYALLQNESSMTFRLLLLGLTGLSVTAVVVLCRRTASSFRQPATAPRTFLWEACFAVVTLLGILSSPHLYMHDWVVFVPAGVLLWSWIRHLPGHLDHSPRTVLGLLAACPFVFWFSQFVAWPPESSIQLVPWYMGFMAIAAFVSIQEESKASQPPNPAQA